MHPMGRIGRSSSLGRGTEGGCHAGTHQKMGAVADAERGYAMTAPVHGPYWKRAHRDWRVRVAAVLMAIALAVFVLTGNLTQRPVVHRSLPASAGGP